MRLLVSSTDLMMVQFLVPHIKYLHSQGWEIDLACSDVGGRLSEVRTLLSPFTRNIHEVGLQRSPLSPKNLKGYRALRKIFDAERYDVVWTNEPVMGVATRLAARKARKTGTKVIYMVHGFHFFNGSSKLNWLLFYPIERVMARFADSIITVNHEDFNRASAWSKNGTAGFSVNYIHGIGINTDRLSNKADSPSTLRQELGLPEDAFIVLSIGELNRNKNQQTIIRAIAELDIPSIHYVLCGKGTEEGRLKALAAELGVADRVHLLGYRKDVVDICAVSDVYAMPSFREGLPVSSLEAMYCGLPLVTSNIRGLVDVNHEGRNGFLCSPSDHHAFASSIKYLYEDASLRLEIAANNRADVIPFTIARTLPEVSSTIARTLPEVSSLLSQRPAL